ncbi:glycoside hydrolase family 125 protein [Mollicutes bacterium LVI A0039]|nr:glycoside hydrolase family 125 protein [Mollicutes bacterium LVI A0039]
MEIINKDIPHSMGKLISDVKEIYSTQSKVGLMFEQGFTNTYQTTIMKNDDETTFVITGDIPAMWNRDSAAQVRPLLNIAGEDEEIKEIIRGVIEMHKRQVTLDPYANAHNLQPCVGDHSEDDLTKSHPLIWERKYEVDSLCYPLQLAYLYWQNTADNSIFDEHFLQMSKLIVDTFIIEQNHHELSDYSFRRIADWLLFAYPERIEFESLPNKGRGKVVGYTGMTWSGFRPSDDACHYGYLTPANMFAVVVLKYLEEIITRFYPEEDVFKARVIKLYEEIDLGIQQHAVIDHPKYGKMYAYEVDGLGGVHLMDDANVPSLLSAPYLGYCSLDDEIYQNTRKFILSKDNPYFYEGSRGKGVGSPHTPPNYFWPIALAIEGMTSTDKEEQQRILNQFLTTDAGTNFMHEGVNVDNPDEYTRPWFSWANAMFAEFILELNNISVMDKE